MKKAPLIPLTLILVSLIFTCGSSDQPREKYFADYEIDGRYSIIGRYPFDPAVTPRTICYKITYDNKDRPILMQFLKAGKLGYGVEPYSWAQTKISYHDYFELRESLNSAGEPVPFPRGGSADNPSRIFSIRLDLNENDERISLTNLNIKRKPYRGTDGVVKYFWTLDENGRTVKSIGINTDEDSVTDANWERERHNTYDDSGNLIEERFIARSGEPCQTDRDNVSVIKMKYDADGNVIEKLLFDLKGNFSKEYDDHLTSYRKRHNKWGQATIIQWLDQADVENSFYVKRCTHQKFDEKGNLIEQSFRDPEGNIIKDSMAYTMTRLEYDDMGNCIVQTGYNSDGSLGSHKIAGYPFLPITHIKYSKDGHALEWLYYNGESILSMGYRGHAIMRATRTETDDGYGFETLFLDPDGEPATALFNFATSKSYFEADEHGRNTFYVFYDTLGKYEHPATHTSFDELGNKIEEKNCDEEGRLMEFGWGALHRYGYNKYGYTLYELVYDSLGKMLDSLNKYDPERPDKKCKDEERFRKDSTIRAKADSIRQFRYNQQE